MSTALRRTICQSTHAFDTQGALAYVFSTAIACQTPLKDARRDATSATSKKSSSTSFKRKFNNEVQWPEEFYDCRAAFLDLNFGPGIDARSIVTRQTPTSNGFEFDYNGHVVYPTLWSASPLSEGSYLEKVTQTSICGGESPLLQTFDSLPGHDRLQREIQAVVSYLQPTSSHLLARNHVTKQFLSALESAFVIARKRNIDLATLIHGSSGTSRALFISDVDMVVFELAKKASEHQSMLKTSRSRFLKFFHILGRILPQFGFSRTQLREGKYHFMQTQHVESGLRFQLVGKYDGVQDSRTETVQHFHERQPHLFPIYAVIKAALETRHLADVHRGGLGSYPLCLLVFAYLELTKEKSLVGQLLGFLSFCSTFDIKHQAIQIVPLVKTVSKLGFSSINDVNPTDLNQEFMTLCAKQSHKTHLLCLQDPVLPDNNLGQNCFAWKHIAATFRFLHNDLQSRLRSAVTTQPLLFNFLQGFQEMHGEEKNLIDNYAEELNPKVFSADSVSMSPRRFGRLSNSSLLGSGVQSRSFTTRAKPMIQSHTSPEDYGLFSSVSRHFSSSFHGSALHPNEFEDIVPKTSGESYQPVSRGPLEASYRRQLVRPQGKMKFMIEPRSILVSLPKKDSHFSLIKKRVLNIAVVSTNDSTDCHPAEVAVPATISVLEPTDSLLEDKTSTVRGEITDTNLSFNKPSIINEPGNSSQEVDHVRRYKSNSQPFIPHSIIRQTATKTSLPQPMLVVTEDSTSARMQEKNDNSSVEKPRSGGSIPEVTTDGFTPPTTSSSDVVCRRMIDPVDIKPEHKTIKTANFRDNTSVIKTRFVQRIKAKRQGKSPKLLTSRELRRKVVRLVDHPPKGLVIKPDFRIPMAKELWPVTPRHKVSATSQDPQMHQILKYTAALSISRPPVLSQCVELSEKITQSVGSADLSSKVRRIRDWKGNEDDNMQEHVKAIGKESGHQNRTLERKIDDLFSDWPSS